LKYNIGLQEAALAKKEAMVGHDLLDASKL